MYVNIFSLADVLRYIVYDYGNRDKLSKEDRTIAGYCFRIILVRFKRYKNRPHKVRLTGAICKIYNGDGRTVIKQALGD